MNYFDPIRKDFQVKPNWSNSGIVGKFVQGVNWFIKKFNIRGGEPLTMFGVYHNEVAYAFLNAFKQYMDDPRWKEERVVDLISDTLTHEYVHKITREDPELAREFKEWKKANSSNPIVAAQKDTNAQEIIAFGMMDEEIRALGAMSTHPAVADEIKEAAAKVVKELMEKSKDSDLRATQWARENGINPRLKMWEFLEAANKATSVNVRKFDSLHSGAIQQGLVPASDDSWFNILRMGGAVTSSSAGTSALFNNKSIGGKRNGKRKKTRKEKDRKTNKTT